MNPRGGYIALMSAIVISVVLMGLLTTLSLSGFFGRFNVLSSEFKERSYAVAQGCADAAIIRLAANPGYVGSTTDTFGGNPCHIFALEAGPSAGTRVIKVQAAFQNAYTNLKLTVNTTTLAVMSFEEVPTLP